MLARITVCVGPASQEDGENREVRGVSVVQSLEILSFTKNPQRNLKIALHTI